MLTVSFIVRVASMIRLVPTEARQSLFKLGKLGTAVRVLHVGDDYLHIQIVKITKKEIEAITSVQCAEPHGILGMHPHKKGKKECLIARAFLDDAKTCELVDVSDPDMK